jgi:tetratricopeptide (TPR) repeat protein
MAGLTWSDSFMAGVLLKVKTYRWVLIIICAVMLACPRKELLAQELKTRTDYLERINFYNDSSGYASMGAVYVMAGNFSDAICYLEKAAMIIGRPITTRENDELFKIHNLLAYIYFKQDKNEMAIQQYNNAIAIEPNSAFMHYQLGLVYFKEARYREGKKAFEKVIEIGDTDESQGGYVELAKRALMTIRGKQQQEERRGEGDGSGDYENTKPSMEFYFDW